MNVTIKSGTNDFHGSLYEFNRVSALAARRTDLVSKPADHIQLLRAVPQAARSSRTRLSSSAIISAFAIASARDTATRFHHLRSGKAISPRRRRPSTIPTQVMQTEIIARRSREISFR